MRRLRDRDKRWPGTCAQHPPGGVVPRRSYQRRVPRLANRPLPGTAVADILITGYRDLDGSLQQRLSWGSVPSEALEATANSTMPRETLLLHVFDRRCTPGCAERVDPVLRMRVLPEELEPCVCPVTFFLE